MKKFLWLNILLSCLILCAGCIDDPVIPNGSINGTVYGEFGMTNPYTFVSAGDYPIIVTDRFGKFTIENTVIPFDLTITNDYEAYVTKYKNLKTSQLSVYGIDDYGYGNTCDVTVLMPSSQNENEEAIIKFISSDLFVQYDYYTYPFLDSAYNLWVTIPPEKSSITGKLIYIGYKRNYDIYSYVKLCIKDVTLNAGYTGQIIRFTSADLAYNPGEKYLNFNVQVPYNSESYYSEVFLNFPGMHPNSSIKIPGDYGQYHVNSVLLPELPQLTYNIKFYNHVLYSNYHPFTRYSRKWIYAQQGENINLIHDKTLTLQYPYDGQSNINDTTKFRFSDTEPGGIYIYRIFYRSPLYRYGVLNVVTDKFPLSFLDFKTRGFKFVPGNTYYWGVYKYPGYNNVNDFATRKIVEDTTYTSIPASESFSFTIR